MSILTIPFARGETEVTFTELPAGIATEQRAYFNTGKSRQLAFRVDQLRSLQAGLRTREDELIESARADLGKPPAETSLTELFLVHREIAFALRHLRRWMRPTRVRGDIVLAPSRSHLLPEPYGVVLIIAPWNYPIQLTMLPLIGAIAAGNCAVLKPSELAPETAGVIRRIIEERFPPEYLSVVEGGPQEGSALLEQDFDHIFFTGSPRLGKIVMRAAAERLTPVTLELGGKNPAVVDPSADLRAAARRIVWARFLNAGQTCVSPDYLLVHNSVKGSLLSEIAKAIRSLYGEAPRAGDDLSRIVNRAHFDRLRALLDGAQPLIGGRCSEESLFIEPTVVEAANADSPLMADEIFGPILPVIGYDRIEEALAIVSGLPAPLAFYLFSGDRALQRRLAREVRAGAVCLNDCVSQMTSPTLPFGGVGGSGMGSYHGYHSFKTFSHFKTVVKRPRRLETTAFKYPPYARRGRLIALARRFLE